MWQSIMCSSDSLFSLDCSLSGLRISILTKTDETKKEIEFIVLRAVEQRKRVKERLRSPMLVECKFTFKIVSGKFFCRFWAETLDKTLNQLLEYSYSCRQKGNGISPPEYN